MAAPNRRKIAQAIKLLCMAPGLFPKTVVAVVLIWLSIGEPSLLSEASSMASKAVEAIRHVRTAP